MNRQVLFLMRGEKSPIRLSSVNRLCGESVISEKSCLSVPKQTGFRKLGPHHVGAAAGHFFIEVFCFIARMNPSDFHAPWNRLFFSFPAKN
jgi:hypothetical protein